MPSQNRNLTVIQGEGRRFSHLKNAAVFYIILALLVILVAQAGYHWLGAQLLARRLQVVAAEPGYMDKIIETDGVIIRSENVVYSPCFGVITQMAPPGERVAVGTPIITLAVFSPEEIAAFNEPADSAQGFWGLIKDFLESIFDFSQEEEAEGLTVFSGEIPSWHTERTVIKCEETGLLSYYLDGWETTVSGQVLLLGDRDDIQPDPAVLVGSFVEAGQPLFKIVNNWNWLYHISLPLDPGRTAAAQEIVTIVFDFAPASPIEARLQEAVIDGVEGEVSITYLLEQQLPGFDQIRWSRASVSFQRLSGLLIPEKALLQQDGESGVFLNSGGTVVFAPVTTLRLQDGLALVEGISPYSIVIGNPEFVREGQRLN